MSRVASLFRRLLLIESRAVPEFSPPSSVRQVSASFSHKIKDLRQISKWTISALGPLAISLSGPTHRAFSIQLRPIQESSILAFSSVLPRNVPFRNSPTVSQCGQGNSYGSFEIVLVLRRVK